MNKWMEWMEVKGSMAPPTRQNSFWEESLKKLTVLNARLRCEEEDEREEDCREEDGGEEDEGAGTGVALGNGGMVV